MIPEDGFKGVFHPSLILARPCSTKGNMPWRMGPASHACGVACGTVSPGPYSGSNKRQLPVHDRVRGRAARTVFGEGLAEDRMHATTSGETLTESVPGEALDGRVNSLPYLPPTNTFVHPN